MPWYSGLGLLYIRLTYKGRGRPRGKGMRNTLPMHSGCPCMAESLAAVLCEDVFSWYK